MCTFCSEWMQWFGSWTNQRLVGKLVAAKQSKGPKDHYQRRSHSCKHFFMVVMMMIIIITIIIIIVMVMVLMITRTTNNFQCWQNTKNQQFILSTNYLPKYTGFWLMFAYNTSHMIQYITFFIMSEYNISYITYNIWRGRSCHLYFSS